MGKCPDCGAWDALERFTEHAAPAGADGSVLMTSAAGAPRGAVPLAEVKPLDVPRVPTGIDELDRVLGGGVVPGSVSLLGGDPGIGKSTLLLQAAARLADAGQTVLYASSEESAAQVRMRADRLEGGTPSRGRHLLVMAEPNLAAVVEEARRTAPALLVLDSIQLAFRPDVEGPPGSLAQLRRCCLDLVALAKLGGIAVAMVGHVTKEGDLAGPKLLEHLVDAVLAFEGDRHHAYRVVRAVKNRFGSTQEVGLFEMTGAGLSQVEEASLGPEAGDDRGTRPGSVFAPVLAGSRVLLAERLAMLIAVLEKHGGLRLADQDIYASAVGGMRVLDPAADLAVALAVAGAFHGRSAGGAAVAFGEIALSGEVRSARQLEQRVHAAVRRGARLLMVPSPQAEAARAACATLAGAPRAEVLGVRSVRDALDQLG